MKEKNTCVKHTLYGVDDVAFEIQIDSTYSIDKKDMYRTYFVTDEGISRHVDQDNLNKCLDPDHPFQFDIDAFFFRGERAASEARMLLDCYMISNHHIEYLNRQIDKYLKNSGGKSTPEIDLEKLYGSMKWPGKHEPFVRNEPKIGRNTLCPCGSGKKYKKCCGSK